MTFRGRVEKGVVVLEESLPLPDGTLVDVQPITDPAAAEALWQGLLKFSGTAKDLPPDMAEEHDHYIHGAPKKPKL